jgi:predicted kinase
VGVPGVDPGETPGARGAGGRSGSNMCRPIKFSKLIRLVSLANSLKTDKYTKLIEIASSTCHERVSETTYRIKTVNDLLKKQGLRSSAFIMYVDMSVDPEKNLIVLDYPFYPLHK